ncbi:hypothetical protein BDY24DRAFT_404464 [Mrakia frigida]|uniref:uncharacterized protein n=1 Tax=Mrakia frigida TaxID=29902 RepID=UPI003FCC1C7B
MFRAGRNEGVGSRRERESNDAGEEEFPGVGGLVDSWRSEEFEVEVVDDFLHAVKDIRERENDKEKVKRDAPGSERRKERGTDLPLLLPQDLFHPPPSLLCTVQIPACIVVRINTAVRRKRAHVDETDSLDRSSQTCQRHLPPFLPPLLAEVISLGASLVAAEAIFDEDVLVDLFPFASYSVRAETEDVELEELLVLEKGREEVRVDFVGEFWREGEEGSSTSEVFLLQLLLLVALGGVDEGVGGESKSKEGEEVEEGSIRLPDSTAWSEERRKEGRRVSRTFALE